MMAKGAPSCPNCRQIRAERKARAGARALSFRVGARIHAIFDQSSCRKWRDNFRPIIEGKSFVSGEPDTHCAVINSRSGSHLGPRVRRPIGYASNFPVVTPPPPPPPPPPQQVWNRSSGPGSIQNADNTELENNFRF